MESSSPPAAVTTVHIYTWDVSAIIKEPLLSEIVDAMPRPAPKMKGAPRIPPGFFDGALREVNLCTRLSQSHGPNNHPTPIPRRRTLGSFSSFCRSSELNRAADPDTQSQSQPLSWIRNLGSGMMRRRDTSDIQLREPPVVEVPCTAGKPVHFFVFHSSPSLLTRFCAEKLSRKKEASCQLLSTSHHTAIQCSNKGYTSIISAITYHWQDVRGTSRSHLYCADDRNNLVP
ncbi:hypothetical protein BDR03DRAFT_947941 [Suillus americanus]|nr:hypothetical protein BDR03DRAFT_947941 [Suillus americanus]